MAENPKITSHDTRNERSQEKAYVVTPEIEDGYNGIVKRLVCLNCQSVFYLTDADYQSLRPDHCHACSKKLVAQYEAKRQQEMSEEEQNANEEIYLAILADLMKPFKDTPEEAFVREHVETQNKKDWKYGFKMLRCAALPVEGKRAWSVVLTKREENSKESIHVDLMFMEWNKHCYIYFPYGKRVFYETSIEERLEKIDRRIQEEPTLPMHYSMKADKLVERGDDRQALEYYDKAIELEDPNIYHYCCKGEVLVRLGCQGEAMDCFEKAISLEPDDLNAYIHKAGLLDRLGRDEEAFALYDGYIAAHPTDLRGYLQKARFYFFHDQYEEARLTHMQGKRASQKAG